MTARIQVPFVGGFNRARSVLVNNQLTVNFIQAVKGEGAKAPVVLETAPGLVELSNLGDGALRTGQMVASGIRAAATENDLYGVYGSKLMAQTVAAGNLEIGTLNANPGRVQMARGRAFIMMVDGVDGYTYDGTTFAQITDLDFPGQSGAGAPTFCLYLDGFFIVNDALTDNFFISDVEDPTSWNALDFTAASVAPDNATAMAASLSLLWILGSESAQAYYNSGNPDFPYDIVLSATQQVGILAPQSIAESDDGIFFLGTTPEGGRFVYRIFGQSGSRISGDDQEDFLNDVIDPSDAYGFIYQQAGKSFYVLQLGASGGINPRVSSTLIFNMKAKAWETREINDGSAWRAAGHGILGGRNIVGSRLQGANYVLDLTDYQDAGQDMIRIRRAQILHQNNYLLDFWSVVIDIEGGIGTLGPPDSAIDPELGLRYSNDGGRTWSDWLYESVGLAGETEARVQFDQLGSSRNRVFEVSLSNAVGLTIIGAYAEISPTAD